MDDSITTGTTDYTPPTTAPRRRSTARDIPYWQLVQVWNVTSLDADVRTEEGDELLPRVHMLISEWPSPEEEALLRERVRLLYQALGELTPIEERVIRLRFGVGSLADEAYTGTSGVKVDRARSLAEVGMLIDRTRERVRQIEEIAMAKLAARIRRLERPKPRVRRRIRIYTK